MQISNIQQQNPNFSAYLQVSGNVRQLGEYGYNKIESIANKIGGSKDLIDIYIPYRSTGKIKIVTLIGNECDVLFTRFQRYGVVNSTILGIKNMLEKTLKNKSTLLGITESITYLEKRDVKINESKAPVNLEKFIETQTDDLDFYTKRFNIY